MTRMIVKYDYEDWTLADFPSRSKGEVGEFF